jgi:hypothetical protein
MLVISSTLRDALDRAADPAQARRDVAQRLGPVLGAGRQ